MISTAISASALDQVTDYTNTTPSDSTIKAGTKIVTGISLKVATVFFAAFETVVRTAVLIAATPLYLLHNKTFTSLKEGTISAAQTITKATAAIATIQAPRAPKTDKPTERIFTKENALFAAKVAAGIVVVGGAIAGAGYLMQAGGEYLASSPNIQSVALKSFGEGLKASGEYVFLAGKYTAYTVLVPMYTVGYELPKWVINKGIPEAVNFVNNNLIQPSIQILTYVRDHVLIPIRDKVTQVVTEYFLTPLMDYVFTPLEDLVLWAGKKIEYGLNLLKDYALTPIINCIKSVSTWVWENMLAPVCTVIQTIGIKIDTFAKAVFAKFSEYVLTPLSNAMHAIADKISEYVLTPLRQAALAIWNEVSDIALRLMRYTWDHIIGPVLGIISSTLTLTYEWLIQPIMNVAIAFFSALATRATTVYRELADFTYSIFANIKDELYQIIAGSAASS